MLTEEQFIQAIYDAASPLVEAKAPGSQEALDGYREYLEKRYSKTYAKISDKINKLMEASLSKIASSEEKHIEQMDFSGFIAAMPPEDIEQSDESAETPMQFDVISEPGQEEFADDITDENVVDAEQQLEVVEDTETDLDQLHFEEPALDTDDMVEIAPEPVVVDTQNAIAEDNAFDVFDNVFGNDTQAPSAAFAQQVEPVATMQAEENTPDLDDDLIDDDELSDADIAAGNNASIPDMALYGIESESIDERLADSAMNRLVDCSNKAFKMLCAVLDGKPTIDNELAYIQVTDELYAISGAVDDDNRETADTLVMETALDLMYVYGKSNTLSVRGQLYSNRNLDIEQRKAQVAARIAQDTSRAVYMSLKDRIADPALEGLCDRYAKAKVAEIFKRIDDSNLDVLDDIRRMMMEREPDKFTNKDEARIIKYMESYAGKHGF